MRSTLGGFGEGVRIILAIIALKDSLGAVRDRKLLSVFVAVLLMISLFRFLPALRDGDLRYPTPGPGGLDRPPFGQVRKECLR